MGTLLWLAALLLPWEHVVGVIDNPDMFPGRYVEDTRVTEGLIPSGIYPFVDLIEIGFNPNLHVSRVQVFAQVLWLAALPLLGVAALLLFFSARARLTRWVSLVGLGLWTAFGTALAISFLHALSSPTSPGEPPAGSLQRLIPTYVASWEEASPAWGFWIFALGLALAWAGLISAAITLWRRREEPVAQEPAPAAAEPEPSRGRRLRTVGAAIATAGVVVWLVALLALPLTHPRCDLGPQVAVADCQAVSGVYTLEAVGLAPVYAVPYPHRLTMIQLRHETDRVETDMWVYLRTFPLLALTLLTMPFVLLALWRRTLSRWGVLGTGLWLALAVAVTWTAIASVAVFISPPTALVAGLQSDPALGLFLLTAAVVGIAVGIGLWLWPRVRRARPVLA